MTLHNAIKNSPDSSVAVIYDHVGLHSNCLDHLDWLGDHIQVVKWIKAAEAAWRFAD